MEPAPHGPAHHAGGSLAGKDALFDSSTGSCTDGGSAGLLTGRPSASSSLVATVGGRDARSAFMSHTMAPRGAWRAGRAQIDWAGVLARRTPPAPSVVARCRGALDLRYVGAPARSDTSMTGRPAARTRPVDTEPKSWPRSGPRPRVPATATHARHSRAARASSWDGSPSSTCRGRRPRPSRAARALHAPLEPTSSPSTPPWSIAR